MSLYTNTVVPPQAYEAVEAAHTILTGDTTNIIVGSGLWIDDTDHVYLHYSTEDNPKPLRYLVVREVHQAGGPMESISRHQVVRFQVMAVIEKNQPSIHKWLSAMHKRIFLSLVGQKPTLTLGTLSLPFNRETVPSAPALDDDTDEWYSTADFFATLQP